jgi:predicted site-specific integrase-resolvase
MRNAPVCDELLTPKQLGDMLGVSRKSIRRYELAGLLNPIKINKRVIRYATSDINRMLSKFKQQGGVV